MTGKPTIVVCLFDQKSNASNPSNYAKLAEMKRVPYTASGVVRYCARLKLLPGPYRPPMDVPIYITRGGEVGAVAFRNFVTDDLAGMTRELEHDALKASTSLSRPWIHGCISIEVSPADYKGEPEALLDMGHALMQMFGVDENRYMLAVHLDSGKIHVHFLYSRVDTDGRLRERDRKMPKFMAEEATALLAHQFGFSLAPHHLSRVTSDGIMDLASDRVVRDLDFGEIQDGMKSRNTARKKTKRNELLTLALVARHEARDLLDFRLLLAPHGLTYEKNGSGAEFVDLYGHRLNASDVDQKRRFTPINMFNGALLIDFPDTPEALQQEAERVRADANLAQDIRAYANLADDNDADARLAQHSPTYANLADDDDPHANMASANFGQPADKASRNPIVSHNDHKEIDRFFALRGATHANATDGEVRWDKAAVAAMKSRPGRPAKDPILPGWPAPTRFDGCLGSRTGRPSRVKFSDTYEMLERAWQTEVWRDGELIASIRYSRIAIVSTKDEDLREALRAAHRAWGSVEVFGKPKFKKQIAKLAAEMDIPIFNPELRDGVARMKKAMAPAVEMPVASRHFHFSEQNSPSVGIPAPLKPAPIVVPHAPNDALPSAENAPAARTASTQLSALTPQTTPDPMTTAVPVGVQDGNRPSADNWGGALAVESGDEPHRRALSVAAELIANQQDSVARETGTARPTVRPTGLDPSTTSSEPVLPSVDVPASSVPSATIAPRVDVASVPTAPTMPTQRSVPIPPSTPAPTTPPTMENTPNPGKLENDPWSQAVRRDVFPDIIHGNWPIRRDPYSPSQMTLYDNEIRAFRIHPGDLEGPEMQARLVILHKQQQADLASLCAAVRNGTIRVVTHSEWKGSESVSLCVTPGSPLREIYQRCSGHPDFGVTMKDAHSQFKAAQREALRLRAAAQAQAAKAAAAAPGATSETGNRENPAVAPSNIPLNADMSIEPTKHELTLARDSEAEGSPRQKLRLDDPQDGAKSPSTAPGHEHHRSPTYAPAQVSGSATFPRTVPLTKQERAELLRPRSLPYTPEMVETDQEKRSTSTSRDVDNAKSAPPRDPAEATNGTPLEGAKEKPAGPDRVDPLVEASKAAAGLSR